jgi:hypothetical protein
MNWLTRLVGLPATRPTIACFVPPISGPNKGPVPQSTIAISVAKVRIKKLVLGDKGAPHPAALVNLVKAVNPPLAALFYFLGPSTLLSTIFRASAKTSAGGRERFRRGQPQHIFIVYRHDKSGLASEIETMEIENLRFEIRGLRS